MIVIYAKDHTQKEVQDLLGPGVYVRNPQFFKNDSDTNAKKVHLFGDYPEIEKAFDCEVVKHTVKGVKSKKKATTKENESAGSEAEKAEDLDEEFLALPENTEFPHKFSGGWHYLSNGEKVNGKANAEKAQAELDGKE